MTERTLTSDVCIVLTNSLADDRPIEGEVLGAARSFGLNVGRADDALLPGVQLIDAVFDRIRHARVIVALVRESDSSWLWMQVGAAIAFRRPVILAIASKSAKLPPEMNDLLTVGPVLSPEALRLAFQRSLKHVRRSPGSLNMSTGVPLGRTSADLLDRLTANQAGSSEARFSTWFASVLDAADVPYDSETPTSSELHRALDRIDFVITASELDGNVGSPLPVELKARGSLDVFLRARANAFESYLDATGARMLLLVALTEIDKPQLSPLPKGFLLTCSARSLVERMENHTFGEAVIELRNEAVTVQLRQ